ncbi:unnamed protein product, partial [Brassica rapa]
FKTAWKVHVKVLHTLKQYNSVSGETLEIILSDECILLQVGTWRNIQNFPLIPSNIMYRSTDNSYKMALVNNTTITRSNHVNEDMFLNL